MSQGESGKYLIGLALIAVIVYVFVLSPSGASATPATVTPTQPTGTGSIPTGTSGTKASLFDTSGTTFADTVLELYPGKNYTGWDASGQNADVGISQVDAAWGESDINSKTIVFAQQRKGAGIKWLFQSLKVKPGTIIEITGQIPAGEGTSFFPEVGFIVAKANITDLTSITKVYPTLQGQTFNVTPADKSWNWAMTGTSLFNYSTSSLNMDFSITIVDRAQALLDAKALYSSCYGMSRVSYQDPVDRAILTCALPDPIGDLKLDGVPTVNTVSQYVTPGLLALGGSGATSAAPALALTTTSE